MGPIQVKQAEKILRNKGYYAIRQESSHKTYTNGIKILPPITLHGKDISPGVWRSILKALSEK